MAKTSYESMREAYEKAISACNTAALTHADYLRDVLKLHNVVEGQRCCVTDETVNVHTGVFLVKEVKKNAEVGYAHALFYSDTSYTTLLGDYYFTEGGFKPSYAGDVYAIDEVSDVMRASEDFPLVNCLENSAVGRVITALSLYVEPVSAPKVKVSVDNKVDKSSNITLGKAEKRNRESALKHCEATLLNNFTTKEFKVMSDRKFKAAFKAFFCGVGYKMFKADFITPTGKLSKRGATLVKLIRDAQSNL